MQENMLFNLSIRENLGLIAPNATEEDIIEALKAACALDSIVESEILDNLGEVFRDKTLIVISHKPLVRLAQDETYLVENKCISVL